MIEIKRVYLYLKYFTKDDTYKAHTISWRGITKAQDALALNYHSLLSNNTNESKSFMKV